MLDCLPQPGTLHTVIHSCAVKLTKALGDILRDSSLKSGEVLKHSGEKRVVIPAVKLTNVLPVQEYTPLRRIKIAAQQLNERGFTRAVQTDDSQLLTRLDGQIHMGKDIFLTFCVAEAYIFQTQFVFAEIISAHTLTANNIERFGVVHVLTVRTDLQTGLMQCGDIVQNCCHPSGKTADG